MKTLTICLQMRRSGLKMSAYGYEQLHKRVQVSSVLLKTQGKNECGVNFHLQTKKGALTPEALVSFDVQRLSIDINKLINMDDS